MRVTLALDMRLILYVLKLTLRMIAIDTSVVVLGVGHDPFARTVQTVHPLRLQQAHAVRHVGVQTIIGSLGPQLAQANAPVPRRQVPVSRLLRQ